MLCRPSFRGVAYLAAANFMARAIILLGDFLNALFSYEMILLYGAHLDSQILLFFQAVFMIPVFLLGCLVFVGIEKESFNLVLYPTLMLLFVVLLRYGAELALLIIHWNDHKLDQAPGVIYYLVVDLIFIAMLLLYVYFSLTAAPIRPTPGSPGAQSIEAPFILSSTTNKSGDPEEGIENSSKLQIRRKKAPAPPPEGEEIPPPRPPPSPKFNYALRRNIGHLPQDSPERALLEELNKQRMRNSQVLQEDEEQEEQEPQTAQSSRLKSQSLKIYETEPKRRSLLIETDLDAEEGNVQSGSEEQNQTKEQEDNKVEEEGTEIKDPDKIAEEVKEEADDESEWEYEYEEEEEEAEVAKPEEDDVTVTLPRPKVQDPNPEVEAQEIASPSSEVVKEDDDQIPTGSKTMSYKTTAV